MQKLRLFGLITWVFSFSSCPNVAVAAPVGFDLAVYTGHAFDLYEFASGVVRSIPCEIPVESFSIAPNGGFLVFSSSASGAGMGLLYEMNLASGKTSRLPSKPFYFKKLNKGERELYSDVAVSPDGGSVAFTVHAVAEDSSDDVVGLAGPLALMNISSGRREAMSSTEHVIGEFPAFVNHPVWSADGKSLLIAFETGGAIVNASENKMRVIDDGFVTKQLSDGFISPMTWWSDYEILIVWSPADSGTSGKGQLYLLDLRNDSVSPAAAALRVPTESTRDVLDVQANSRLVLLRHSDGSELFTREGRAIKRWGKGEVPGLRLYR